MSADRWNTTIAALHWFTEHYGHLPNRDHPLYAWYLRQRTRYDLLTEEQRTALDKAAAYPGARWLDAYRRNLAKILDPDTPPQHAHNSRFWLKQQREQIEHLPPVAADLIRKAPGSVRETQWRQRADAVAVAVRAGRLEEPDRRWLADQHLRHRHLADWQQQILDDIGPAHRRPNNYSDEQLAASNTTRAQVAAARTTTQAQALLNDPNCPPAYRRILRARAAHPYASLRELAGRLGMTKHAYASTLRRALARAE